MELEELLKIESDAILHKPMHIDVGEEKIEIKPLTIAQLIEINPYLIKIKKEDWSKFDEFISKRDTNDTLEYMNKYLPLLLKVVNICTGKDLSKSATMDQILYIFFCIHQRMQAESFLKSIILVQRMSLQTQEGIIAACTTLAD